MRPVVLLLAASLAAGACSSEHVVPPAAENTQGTKAALALPFVEDDYARALPYFEKATDADPNYAEAYYQYGLSLMGKATIVEGKTVAPAGTAEAFQKYLDLAPNGPNAAVAKDMMASMGATVQTNFKAAPAQQKKKQ